LGTGVRASARDRFGDGHGTAVLCDLKTRRVTAIHRPDLAGRWLIPPGSTLKPFSLWALIANGKLRPEEEYRCPRKLTIAERSFDCTHPPIAEPIRVPAAIAYSCNCFVAHFAARFASGELARFLAAHGMTSPAEITPASHLDDRQLQAIGEQRVLVTPTALLAAYADLAARAPEAIRYGLEGAVEYGTAQLAASPKMKVAGKTGTVVTSSGARVVWFAGFAPSRTPAAVIAVALQGRSGGLDAAPIAGSLLAEHLARK
jgi:cell division protein FtsI/penicillin-binding protein 2